MITFLVLLTSMVVADVKSTPNVPVHAETAPQQKEHVVTRHELVGEKRGRIVDAETGTGIADATIIAAWDMSSFTGWRNAGGCVVRRILSTDASGNFTIPDVSREPMLEPPHFVPKTPEDFALVAYSGAHTEFSWHLAVFKPGYLREGDLEAFKVADPHTIGFLWQSASPETTVTHNGYQLKPIALRQTELLASDTIIYLQRLWRFAANCEGTNPPPPPSAEFAALVEQIHVLVRPLPCTLPESAPISAEVAMDYSQLVAGPDTKRLFDRMNQQMHKRWPWTDTTAGMLCWASGGRENRP